MLKAAIDGVKWAMHSQVWIVWVISIVFQAAASGSDWPQFLGPTRNGVYEGPELAASWPSGGPAVVWQKAVGHGFSGLVVEDHKLILFHRVGDTETVECLDATSGSNVWRFSYATSYQDDF